MILKKYKTLFKLSTFRRIWSLFFTSKRTQSSPKALPVYCVLSRVLTRNLGRKYENRGKKEGTSHVNVT